jgi:hypothetical protein
MREEGLARSVLGVYAVQHEIFSLPLAHGELAHVLQAGPAEGDVRADAELVHLLAHLRHGGTARDVIVALEARLEFVEERPVRDRPLVVGARARVLSFAGGVARGMLTGSFSISLRTTESP